MLETKSTPWGCCLDQELAHVVLENSAAITVISATIGRKEMTGMDKGEELYFKYRTGSLWAL